MSNSPIEWMGEEPGHDVPDTEYGGATGLIQPGRGEVLLGDPAASGGHMLSGDGGQTGSALSEKAQIMSRVGHNPLSPTEGHTGVPDTPGIIEDPMSGTMLPPDASVAVDPLDPAGSTGMSDLKDSLGGEEVVL